MNIKTTNEESAKLWFANNGNYTHAIDYPLNENSMVIDLGGYLGLWADTIIGKYNPYLTLVEPIPEFYNKLKEKFKNNPKVNVLNYGVSDINRSGELYFNGDGTSQYAVNNKPILVNFITIDELLKKINKDKIELMQINIEGEEYKLLDNMFNTGSVLKFDNIQIQFHTFIDNAVNKRIDLQNKFVKNNFKKLYDYPFVFEGWSQNKTN